METDRIERIEQRFEYRYKIKKFVNVLISAAIFISGVLSLVYIWNYDQDGLLTFRWLTVDGTIFTSAIAFFYVIVSILEILHYTELTNRYVYFMRLASAVAESLILVVVLLSQLPFSNQHLHIFRFDMFQMHVLIPVLTVASFILNDSPIGKLNFLQKLHGTWFITLYAVVIITLIKTGILLPDKIPYFFLDVTSLPFISFLGYVVFVYALGITLSYFLSCWNRKLSWIWFRGITDS